jgi:hypothetical protein
MLERAPLRLAIRDEEALPGQQRHRFALVGRAPPGLRAPGEAVEQRGDIGRHEQLRVRGCSSGTLVPARERNLHIEPGGPSNLDVPYVQRVFRNGQAWVDGETPKSISNKELAAL